MSSVSEKIPAPTLAQESDAALARKKIDLIALDFDGVFHPAGMPHVIALTHAFNKTCDAFDISPEIREAVKMLTKAQKRFGMANYIQELTLVTQRNTRDFITYMIEHTNYPDILPNPALLTAIREVVRDIPMCVLSNNYRAHIDKVSQSLFGKTVDQLPLPVYDITKNINASKNAYYPKQDPRGFNRVCADFNVMPNHIVLLDDSPKIVQAARAIGVQGYVVSRAEEVPALLYRLQKLQRGRERA